VKKIILGIIGILLISILTMGVVTRQFFTQPEYAKKFTGYVDLTGADTIVGTATDTIMINLHTVYENYFPPADTASSIERTVWCIAIYADSPHADSTDWDLWLDLSPDSIHWNYRGAFCTHTLTGDSLLLYAVTKDADLMQYLRLRRTGGADNEKVGGSIGHILLLWQNRGIKQGNEVQGAEY